MAAQSKVIDAAGIRERAARAHAFLVVADEAEGAPTSAVRAVGLSNAVEAGIAASDAICGHRLGEHSHGEDHRAAVALLKRALPDDSNAAAALGRLLDVKNRAQYGSGEISKSLWAQNLERARRLVNTMDAVLERSPGAETNRSTAR